MYLKLIIFDNPKICPNIPKPPPISKIFLGIKFSVTFFKQEIPKDNLKTIYYKPYRQN